MDLFFTDGWHDHFIICFSTYIDPHCYSFCRFFPGDNRSYGAGKKLPFKQVVVDDEHPFFPAPVIRTLE